VQPVACLRSVLLASFGLFLTTVAAEAQAGFTTFQFSFSNPGARSMGLGGAFVALADDATAAFANPAGLVQIVEPEVSAELRSWHYSTPYTVGGRLNGEPSGFGLDTTSGLRLGESSQTVSGVSFVSLVYPRGRWSLGFYAHQLSSFEFRGETQGLFAIPHMGQPGVRREPDRRFTTDYDLQTYGFSAAWQVNDTLSLGVALVYFDLALHALEEFFVADSPERFSDRNSYLPRNNVQNLTFDLDESDQGISLGFLWSPAPAWRVGGVFREGASADRLAVEFTSGPFLTELPPGTSIMQISSPIDFPDTYGLGAAYRLPGDRWTVSFEWDRVDYSAILESLTFEIDSVLDDADELHLGAELVLPDRQPILAFRGGLWLDPDHRQRIEGTGGDELDRAFFRAGDDELHLAAGIGVVFRRFQLDAGLDLSELVDTFSISTIYAF
jgi:long-subunit fatty acid transport protein